MSTLMVGSREIAKMSTLMVGSREIARMSTLMVGTQQMQENSHNNNDKAVVRL
jgi:hypothetical protein